MWAELIAFLRCRWRVSKQPCCGDYAPAAGPDSLLTSATGVVLPPGVTHQSLFIIDDGELQRALDVETE